MSNNRNLKQKAYDVLKQKILSNELKAGEYLEEKALCALLEISRTPIREAITLLQQENLVQIIPNKGFFVSPMSVQTILDVFEVRQVIEPYVLRSAFSNLNADTLLQFKERSIHMLEAQNYSALHELDYEFHNYITSCAKNSFMKKINQNVSDNFQRIRTQDFYSKERTENGAREHLQLIELFIKGDLEESVKLLQKHISSTESFFMKSII